ncbi:MAG: NAD-dependent epimerase/dehydratase family protein [Bacteroidales bacterium]|jgi:nucleoside-diphosphate-sugar epimerase|nr:NAD-dependent epimerase/dehydratase family protein [Bacteroidales bacterium]
MSAVAFVTGGTGLVGTHLILALLQAGYRVRALKRPSSDLSQVLRTFSFYDAIDADSFFRSIEWVEADLFDVEELAEQLEGCDYVFHTAAVVSFQGGNKQQMLRTNVEGTANMVNVCLKKMLPLCFVSSIAALGRAEPGHPATEEDIWQTSDHRSPYSCSKYQSEMEVWRGVAEGLNAVIVNPSVILGPGNWEKGSLTFFSRVYKGMRFHTSGITGFVDVRDVAGCMVGLMERECFGERFILSSGELSYHQLFDMIAEGLHVKKPMMEARPWMLNTAYRLLKPVSKLTGKSPALTKETAHSAFQQLFYSNEKIRKTLFPFEFIPLQQTIEDCCRYFLQQKQESLK